MLKRLAPSRKVYTTSKSQYTGISTEGNIYLQNLKPRVQTNYFPYVCVSGDKKCLFYGNFGLLCFLEAPVLRFTLLPY